VTARYKNVWFRPSKVHKLGTLSFGIFWFSILWLPIAMVASSVGLIGLFLLHSELATIVFRATWIAAACTYVYTIGLAVQLDGQTGRGSWREAVLFPGFVSIVVMITAFFPGLLEVTIPGLFGLRMTEQGETAWTLFVYVWISLAMVGAWVAKVVDGTRIGRFLSPALIYLVGYGPLLCAVTVDAYVKELTKAEAKWDKTEKIGRVLG